MEYLQIDSSWDSSAENGGYRLRHAQRGGYIFANARLPSTTAAASDRELGEMGSKIA